MRAPCGRGGGGRGVGEAKVGGSRGGGVGVEGPEVWGKGCWKREWSWGWRGAVGQGQVAWPLSQLSRPGLPWPRFSHVVIVGL